MEQNSKGYPTIAKIEEILQAWEADSHLDPLRLTEETTQIPRLHHKYFTLLVNEQKTLRALDASYKTAYREKFEFYTQGPTKESAPKTARWDGKNSFPAKGLSSTKKEIDTYIDADEDIIRLNLKIGAQKEKLEVLESILNMISNRSFLINTIVKWEIFRAGGNG